MSEYLSEEEQIARMKSWWDENGTSLIVTLVVCVAAVGGWQWYGSHSEARDFEAARVYAEYQEAQGEARTAAAATITSDHAGSAYHTFVLFDQASEAAEAGDLEAAAGTLEAAVDTAGDDLLADLARVRLAKVQQGLDRSQAALATLASIKSTGYRALALEVQGDIHAARGDMSAAHQAYEAAVASLSEGDVRPVLDMKLKNAAPFEGSFVPQTDSLATALQEAEAALGADAETGTAEETAEETTEETAAEAIEETAADTTAAAVDAAAEQASDAADTPAEADDE